MTTTYETQDLLTAWNGWHTARERELAAEYGWLSLTGIPLAADHPGRARRAAGALARRRDRRCSTADRACRAGALRRARSPVRPSTARSPRRSPRPDPCSGSSRAPSRSNWSAGVGGTPSGCAIPRRRSGPPSPGCPPSTSVRAGSGRAGTPPFDAGRTDRGGHRAVRSSAAHHRGRHRRRHHRRPRTSRWSPRQPGGRLKLSFRDLTNGDLTAPWRVVTTSVPTENGDLVVDFNRAVNLPFAFTEFGTCPAPVPGNALPVPVTAGELAPIRVTGPTVAE